MQIFMMIISMKIKMKRVIYVLNVIIVLTHNNIMIFIRLHDKGKFSNERDFFFRIISINFYVI